MNKIDIKKDLFELILPYIYLSIPILLASIYGLYFSEIGNLKDQLDKAIIGGIIGIIISSLLRAIIVFCENHIKKRESRSA